MLKNVRLVSLIAAIVVAAFSTTLPSEGKRTRQATTACQVHNVSGAGAYVVITTLTGGLTPSINYIQVNGVANWVAPSGPPPPQDSGHYLTCPPSTNGCANPPVQGFFFLPNGGRAVITSTIGQNILNGISFSFYQPPYACPGASNGFYPFVPEFLATNGVNLAEVSLNVSTGETVDISCNDGANSVINVVASGGPYWYMPAGKTAAFSTTNSWVNGSTGQDNNCGIQGVFPYQFTECTAGPNACPNAASNTSCSTSTPNNGPCEYTRHPGQTGGLVVVRLMGAEAPPQ